METSILAEDYEENMVNYVNLLEDEHNEDIKYLELYEKWEYLYSKEYDN